jgi:hypothetical protein
MGRQNPRREVFLSKASRPSPLSRSAHTVVVVAISTALDLLGAHHTMGVTFESLSTPEGLKKLDEYLLTRSYISG